MKFRCFSRAMAECLLICYYLIIKWVYENCMNGKGVGNRHTNNKQSINDGVLILLGYLDLDFLNIG